MAGMFHEGDALSDAAQILRDAQVDARSQQRDRGNAVAHRTEHTGA